MSDSESTEVGHCKRDEIDVYVGRGYGGEHLNNTEIGERGWLGNPYSVDEHGREGSIEMFRADFEERLEEDESFKAAVADLAGQKLGCWCQQLGEDGPACHGEVIKEHADRLSDGESADSGCGHEHESVDESEPNDPSKTFIGVGPSKGTDYEYNPEEQTIAQV